MIEIEVMITVTNLYFCDIEGYGTNVIHLAHPFLLQYVVLVSEIVTSANEAMRISIKP